MTRIVKIAQWGEPVEVDDDQTLLEAALEQGVPYPHGCRSGNCGACKSRLYAGSVEMEALFRLRADGRGEGKRVRTRLPLACPQENLEVAWLNDDEEMVAHPLRRFEATIAERTEMTHDIVRLRLTVPEGVDFAYTARPVCLARLRRPTGARLLHGDGSRRRHARIPYPRDGRRRGVQLRPGRDIRG